MVYLVIAAVFFGITAPAHAYIDAGSGSYMLQMAMGGILAVAFTLKMYWQRLRAFLVKTFTRHSHTGTRG